MKQKIIARIDALHRMLQAPRALLTISISARIDAAEHLQTARDLLADDEMGALEALVLAEECVGLV